MPVCPVARSLHLPARVLDGGPVLLPLNDRRTFQLAYVQDVASALVLAGTHPEAAGKAFNAVGDELWTHERLVHALAAANGSHTPVVRVSQRALDKAGLAGYEPPYGCGERCTVASNDLLKSLGWRPTPPEIWMPRLLEAARDPRRKPYYSFRARELALARQAMDAELRPSGINGCFLSAAKMTVVNTTVSAVSNEHPDSRAAWNLLPKDHFRIFLGRKVSSIGMGTHRGDADDETDASYTNALKVGLAGGLNLIDTAINYRAMRSERLVGRVVNDFLAIGNERDSVFVVSKGGFVPHDAADPRSARAWVEGELISTGLLSAEDGAARHSINVKWIADSLRRSLDNLKLGRIDAYLLHNPERIQNRLGERFWVELTRTFAFLEEAVAEGKIASYGLALWDAVRRQTADDSQFSIERALDCAQVAAAGLPHNLKALEVPFNVENASALRTRNQLLHGRMASILELAKQYGLFVFTSASVARGGQFGKLGMRRLPVANAGQSDLLRALQFARSAPAVGTALVGIRRTQYAEDALSLAQQSPLLPKQIEELIANA